MAKNQSPQEPTSVKLTKDEMLTREYVINAMTNRAQLLGKLFEHGDRDIDEVCGYPDTIEKEEYYRMYRRSMGKRVVNFEPSKCWQTPPLVFENEDPEQTDFEESWMSLCKDRKVFHYLKRIDQMSGIGRFGILLMGWNDGKELSEPLEDGDHELLYLRPFAEIHVTIGTYETNDKSERFGLPLTYNVDMVDPQDEAAIGRPSLDGSTKQSADSTTTIIHWTRVLHVCDNRESSEIFGLPRQEDVWEELLDLRKVGGGSAEMYWQGARPGLAFEVNPDIVNATIDKEELELEMQEYTDKLKRYLAIEGVTVKSLQPQVSAPGPFVDKCIERICITKGWPKRIFMGSERGELASTQDEEDLNDSLRDRQISYLEPLVLRPFIDIMMKYGVLPEVDEYSVEWSDLNETSEDQKASTALKKTEALSKYVGGNVATIMPESIYYAIVLGMTQEEIDAIESAVEDREDDLMGDQTDAELFVEEDEEAALEEEGSEDESSGGPASADGERDSAVA